MSPRRLLDAIYTGAGVLAGVFLVLICILVIAAIAWRILGLPPFPFDEFAGYSMAASSFLGLAHTFRRNEHIRVTLVVDRLPQNIRQPMEIVILATALCVVGYFAYFAVDMVVTSYQINELSNGLLPVPLWIPQLGLALGVVVMALALTDDLLAAVLRHKHPSYQEHHETEGEPLTENI